MKSEDDYLSQRVDILGTVLNWWGDIFSQKERKQEAFAELLVFACGQC